MKTKFHFRGERRETRDSMMIARSPKFDIKRTSLRSSKRAVKRKISVSGERDWRSSSKE